MPDKFETTHETHEIDGKSYTATLVWNLVDMGESQPARKLIQFDCECANTDSELNDQDFSNCKIHKKYYPQ